MTDAEITRAVAEKVMGWRLLPPQGAIGYSWWEDRLEQFMFWAEPNPFGRFWNPCNSGVHKANANHTLLVIERMRELGWDFILEWKQGARWYPLFFHYPNWDNQYGERHKSFGHAVCLAALKAVEEGK